MLARFTSTFLCYMPDAGNVLDCVEIDVCWWVGDDLHELLPGGGQADL